ncbi:sugar ABC transporter permease [Microbacterium aoyamense]|uniref:Sugar ABC transporter permease n=1 Tax=Microbacterium aoyamense TaxID=344166 RepID=A0ABP5ASY1_9MICO|nr:sugar ABC transporter permease [Microbacterium aoyamense]
MTTELIVTGGRKRTSRLRPNGYPWIIPALVLSIGVVYFSIGFTAYISTLDWDGISPNPESVGGANFVEAFQDPVFWMALWHTVVFFVVTFAIQTFLGIVFATLLHSQIWFKGLYKVIIFVPVVLAPAIMAPVFRQIFGADGQFNAMLEFFGLGFLAQPWLAQSSTALPIIMAVTIWQWTGLNFILYYAAMSQIDPEILEAARMDGAGNVRIVASMIWPGVRGTTIAIAILSAIGALKTFDVPYLVTNGGPNYATEFLGTLIYRESIPLAHVGYGAALSILLLVLAVTMALVIQMRAKDRKEFESV